MDRDYELPCCGGPNPQRWGPGTRRHLPECAHFKPVAEVSLRTGPRSGRNLCESIGDGRVAKAVIVTCNNGVTVEVYPDGSVKQTQHDGAFRLHGVVPPKEA